MAPNYTFTGEYPRIMTGLSEGINAHVNPADGRPQLVIGQTIILEPGDALVTAEPYPHPELTEDPATGPTLPLPVATPAPGAEAPTPDSVPAAPAPAPTN